MSNIKTYKFIINGSVVISGLSLKGAQKLLLRKYNECFCRKRKYAKTWGIAVADSNREQFGAKKTDNNGNRVFYHYGNVYKIENELNFFDSIKDRINDLVGVGGYFPFEHGFEKPILVVDGKKVAVYSVANDQVRTMHNFYIPLDMIEEKQLEKLLREMVKYIDYCVNEA